MWIWIQIVLVLFCVLFVINAFIRPDVIKKKWFACLSIVLTLFGITIAIAEDYLSQYDYDKDTILKYETYRKKGISFEDLLPSKSTTPPEYIFVMDVSGSMSSKDKEKKRIPMTESLSNQLEVIQKGRFGTSKLDFGIKDDKIPFDEAMRLKLLYSLAQLEKLNYPNDSKEYSIVFFADKCNRHYPSASKSLRNRIDESFDTIMQKQYGGKETNFLELFNYLYDEYFANQQIHDSSKPHRNPFGKKDYIALFYSDYEHDIKEKDIYKTKKELDSIIK